MMGCGMPRAPLRWRAATCDRSGSLAKWHAGCCAARRMGSSAACELLECRSVRGRRRVRTQSRTRAGCAQRQQQQQLVMTLMGMIFDHDIECCRHQRQITCIPAEKMQQELESCPEALHSILPLCCPGTDVFRSARRRRTRARRAGMVGSKDDAARQLHRPGAVQQERSEEQACSDQEEGGCAAAYPGDSRREPKRPGGREIPREMLQGQPQCTRLCVTHAASPDQLRGGLASVR